MDKNVCTVCINGFSLYGVRRTALDNDSYWFFSCSLLLLYKT